MTYLVSHYWGWMLVAAALGFLGAKSAHGDEYSSRRPTWFFVAAALLALGGAADFMHLLNGRPVLWLKTAALSFAAFVIGAQVEAPGKPRGFIWGRF